LQRGWRYRHGALLEKLKRLAFKLNNLAFGIKPGCLSIFGPNATLDVGGSFVATAANALRLGDTGLFSASEPAKSNDTHCESLGTIF
jgi:hypothetical protein